MKDPHFKWWTGHTNKSQITYADAWVQDSFPMSDCRTLHGEHDGVKYRIDSFHDGNYGNASPKFRAKIWNGDVDHWCDVSDNERDALPLHRAVRYLDEYSRGLRSKESDDKKITP